MRFRPLFAALVWVAGLTPAFAQDIPGGKDHPLVGRYDGSALRLYVVKDFEEQRILVKPITSADRQATGKRINANNSVVAAGKSYRIKYDGPAGRSPLEVARNLTDALKRNGFEILFQCRTSECSGLNGSELYFGLSEESPMGRGDLHSGPPDLVFTSAVRRQPQGDVYVSIYSAQFAGKPETLVDVIETRPMEADKIVFVDASQMQKGIAAEGKVALYGILFDFDKATIRPDSKPTLDEIAKFLTANAGLKVIVTGHTDGKGGFDYNIDLSKRRAAAVVEALTRQYGIAPARLRAFGAGMAAPVSSNDSAADQAKNRRVELVKFD